MIGTDKSFAETKLEYLCDVLNKHVNDIIAKEKELGVSGLQKDISLGQDDTLWILRALEGMLQDVRRMQKIEGVTK